MNKTTTNTALIAGDLNGIQIHISPSEFRYPRFQRFEQLLLSFGLRRMWWSLVERGFFVRRVKMPAGTIAGLTPGTYYVCAQKSGKHVFYSAYSAIQSKDDQTFLGKVTLPDSKSPQTSA